MCFWRFVYLFLQVLCVCGGFVYLRRFCVFVEVFIVLWRLCVFMEVFNVLEVLFVC